MTWSHCGRPIDLGKMLEELTMGLYDDLGLDKKVDLNSFKAEDAAKVFEEAAKKLRNSKATKDTVQTLTAAGFTVLKILAMFA